ncbi:MAG: sulfotransferase [Halorhodospira sp.]
MRTLLALLEGAWLHIGWWLQAVVAWRDPRAPMGASRALVLLVGGPLLLLVQVGHFCCFLLDELLYPAYRRQPIGQALFVIGVPRSGTTFVHRTLAEDGRRFRAPQAWEVALAPAICQRRLLRRLAGLDAKLGGYGRRGVEQLVRRLTGGLDAIHPVDLAAPEEDYLTLLPAGGCFLLLLLYPSAAGLQGLSHFQRRLSAGRQKRLLDCYERCLQRQLYADAGLGEGAVLLSKNAAFGSWLQPLYERFPQARFLVCLREPRSALSSQISSVQAAERLGVAVRGAAFQQELIDAYAGSLEHLEQAVEQCAPDRAVVLDAADLRTDPGGVLRAALERLGEPVDGALADLLARQQEAGPGTSRHHHDPAALAWAQQAIEVRLWPPYRHLLASAYRIRG